MQKEYNQPTHSNQAVVRAIALDNFFESAPMMMGIADLEGEDIRHVSDNKAAAKFFGRPAEAEYSRSQFTTRLGFRSHTG